MEVVPPLMEIGLYGTVVLACVHHIVWGRHHDAARLAALRQPRPVQGHRSDERPGAAPSRPSRPVGVSERTRRQ
ncbi:MAG: hypothetical protein HXX10_19615 [Rhodoplanes sp.]|uniref:hypothetical protein n=1 Tax=Rhodoplanes sp. TaxID=1968906 RepID=UPI0017D1D1F5|nr:hypothetical protein [Rhodoplanes sp.]NVO16246.1 hypothetical protein [Rhodoplanes sp.]